VEVSTEEIESTVDAVLEENTKVILELRYHINGPFLRTFYIVFIIKSHTIFLKMHANRNNNFFFHLQLVNYVDRSESVTFGLMQKS
jgi:hypothetical protein